MNVKVFGKPFEIRHGIYSFVKPEAAVIAGTLDEQAAALMASHFGFFKGKTFLSQRDANGAITIGVRYKPVAIVIPEGHPSYTSGIVLAHKLAKIVR